MPTDDYKNYRARWDKMIKNKNKVAILLATYNGEHYIEKQLYSLA